MSAPSSLTLWDIEQAVLGLSEVIESPDTTEEEKQAARGELEHWVQAEVQKADGIKAFVRHCQMMIAEADKAEKEFHGRGNLWQNRLDSIKGISLAAMQAMGKKRIEGKRGVLRIQTNGGKQKLNITREDLVPDEYCETTVTFRTPQWNRITESLAPAVAFEIARVCKIARAPNNEAIRKALEAKCPVCGGLGKYTALVPDESPEFTGLKVHCDSCRGTGHQLVAGCELAERGVSLRVE